MNESLCKHTENRVRCMPFLPKILFRVQHKNRMRQRQGRSIESQNKSIGQFFRFLQQQRMMREFISAKQTTQITEKKETENVMRDKKRGRNGHKDRQTTQRGGQKIES